MLLLGYKLIVQIISQILSFFLMIKAPVVTKYQVGAVYLAKKITRHLY